ncbi:MAG: hypothetical protein QME51_08875 [Planctomycetota bacterium]|nr:hypothetical protein [Planctomycetota bacterium]
MIKLDLHITNKASVEWQDAMRAALEKRTWVEQKAKEYEANTGEHIRPICLIQAERTGAEQRGTRFIHAEDVKEYLIKQCGVPVEHVAIKSSEKDDIEGIDLMVKGCPIRYIITKQALQEGWDCAFAYILTILTNPSSQLGITQLVGRILRQPQARKTKVKELDESYVFCFRQKAKELLENIRSGFADEGLGDLAGRIALDEGDSGNIIATGEKVVGYRGKYKQFEGKVYLPRFVMQEGTSWRDVNYEMDILSRIDWNKINLEPLKDVVLTAAHLKEQEVVVGLSKDAKEVIKEKGRVTKEGGLEINSVFITRQILDIIINPWIAHDFGKKMIDIFRCKYDIKMVTDNLVFIIEELRKLLEKERDRLAETVFRELVQKKTLCFFLQAEKGGFGLRKNIRMKNIAKQLVRNDNTALQKSLLEIVPDELFNTTETSVALYLDEQEKLLWWYRNLARLDYYVQGWKKHRVWADFIFADIDNKNRDDYSKVYVVETKGIHLKNEDTDYKKNVFKFCNELGEQRDWNELKLEFPNKRIEFQVIFENEWQKRINEILAI